MQFFPVDDATVSRVLREALARGGNYADVYFEHTHAGSVALLDDVVNRASSNVDYGAGVRTLQGERSGYAYTEDVTPAELLRAARTASAIADGSGQTVVAALDGSPRRAARSLYHTAQSLDQVGLDTFIPYLQHLRARIVEAEPRVVRVTAAISWRTRRIAFANSLGQTYEDMQPMAAISVSAVARDGSVTETATTSRSHRMGIEMLTDALSASLADECVRRLRFALTATRPHGGEMPVVMAAGASGILLHEAIGHAFEADFNRRGESIFSGRLGQQVCDTGINVVDDGTLPSARGSINYDDEGVESQKTYIVQDGRLDSYLHDRISAAHYGVPPTGNGRRESFRNLPLPRMRNTYMESGTATEADLIASVKQGIYVCDFTNGQVQIGAGDFTFYVKSGYLIEGGRLTRPVKDINIIGNGPAALADIHGVASDMKIDHGTWTCGKDGQTCPVTCGMPSVLVRRLTVGGV